MGFFSLALGVTLAILYIAGCSPATTTVTASGDVFSVDLIHRDSIGSPFYDHGITISQRLGRAVQRSFKNARRFNSNSSTYQGQITADEGEYLLNVSFGSPPHQVLAIADTGSDLSWIPCRPCIQCYKHVGSNFDPNSSSTYNPVGCNSKVCKSTSINADCSATKTCPFSVTYGDGSYSYGDVATETVRLGGRAIQDIVFGCSFRNGGVFKELWVGIIGLGGGASSLVSQISKLVTPKFSYCLIPYPTDNHLAKLSSKLIFGDIDFGSQAVSTPLVPRWPTTYYFITLKGITVGDTRLNYSDSKNPFKPMHKGNTVVDSGTTLTMLPEKLYNKVEAAIKENLKGVTTVQDPEKQLRLCYRSRRVKHAPNVTFHFEGVDVPLLRYNVFMTVSKRIMCLAMAPNSDGAIFGNVAQSNLLIGYDVQKKSLSFRRTDCTSFKV